MQDETHLSTETKTDMLRELERLRRRVEELEGRGEDQDGARQPGVPAEDLRREVRRTQRLYEILVNSVDGIVWEADANTFEFTFVSEQAERLLGYPVDRWLNEPGFWLEHLHPDDRDWAPSFCYNATQARKDHEFEYRMLAADGRAVWLKDIVTVVAEGDEVTKIRGLLVDVTREKQYAERRTRAEQRIQRQRLTLMALATSAELARGHLTGLARRATESVASTLGVERVSIWFFNDDRSKLRCRDLYELSADRHSAGAELAAVHYPRYFAALEVGRAVAADDAHKDPSTSELSSEYLRPLGISSMLDAPLRRSGAVAGVVCHEHVGPSRKWSSDEIEFAASVADLVCLALETEERRKAETEAQQAREAFLDQQRREQERVEAELERAREQLVRRTRLSTIGQVAASMAHELRNPLGTIRNAVYYLMPRLPQGDDKWRQYMGIIEQEVHTADRIICNLLEMSRSKSPQKQRIDLARAVRKAFDSVGDTEAIRLLVDLEPEDFTVDADPDQLAQVLGNLISNAVQVSPVPTRVEVTARREDDTDHITVADDGPGVPEDNRQLIFEPLFSTKTKGSGLGLAICRQILERHGGALELLDRQAGGAAFRVSLPHVRAG